MTTRFRTGTAVPSNSDRKNPSQGRSDTFSEDPSQSDESVRVVRFQDLVRCGNEVWIRNGNELYRLQQTRQGKLILTK